MINNFMIITLIILLFCSQNSHAQMLDASLFIPPKQQKVQLKAGAVIENSLHQEEGSVNIPIYKEEQDLVSVVSKYGVFSLDADALLPNNGILVPRRLVKENFGALYTHHFSPGKFLAFSSNVGSSSDSPFANSGVVTVEATALYGFPDGETEHWVLLLSYSNNRTLLNDIPLPGFAYTYTPSKAFRGVFGVPFASITWQFIPQWTLSAFMLSLSKAKLEVSYSYLGFIQLFVAGDYEQQAYLRSLRPNWKDRMFYDEKRIFTGVKMPISQVFFADLSTGYAFDRGFMEAESYGWLITNKVALSNSWFATMSLSARF